MLHSRMSARADEARRSPRRFVYTPDMQYSLTSRCSRCAKNVFLLCFRYDALSCLCRQTEVGARAHSAAAILRGLGETRAGQPSYATWKAGVHRQVWPFTWNRGGLKVYVCSPSPLEGHDNRARPSRSADDQTVK